MIGGAQVLGLKKLEKKLDYAHYMKRQKFKLALFVGGLYLQRLSQKIVPVDLGNLKASATTRYINSSTFPAVTVGYTAAYAVYVHEDMEAAHGDGQQAKFLEGPLRENRREIIEVVNKKLRGLKP